MNLLKKLCRFSLFFLSLVVFINLIGCKNINSEDVNLPARYGENGRLWATELAREFPERYPGSEQEKAAALWIKSKLEELGYEPHIQEFDFEDNNGEQKKSENIILEIPGTGFKYVGTESGMNSEVSRINERFLVVGTHYDTPPKSVNADDTLPAEGDGIHNNAAGVATLLTIAKELRNDPAAYNIRLVFFGANGAKYVGAQAFLNNLSQTELELIDAMYNIDRIYAGDKVYAHAGQNSVISEHEKSYDKRKKLYELTDVYYNYLLLTNNDFSLSTNQSIYTVEASNLETPVLFREWTTHLGDHTPFDQRDIPIVFIESFEYNVESFDELGKESTDPKFSVVNGVIDGSNLDSSVFLNEYFKTLEEDENKILFGNSVTETEKEEKDAEQEETTSTLSLAELRNNKHIDRLERRINNIAFLIIKSSQRGDVDFEQKK